jgi:hypothetical protein
MRQPPAFKDKDTSDAVPLLKKALYGLLQPGCGPFLHVKSFLEELSITTVNPDVTLYHSIVQGQPLLLCSLVTLMKTKDTIQGEGGKDRPPLSVAWTSFHVFPFL